MKALHPKWISASKDLHDAIAAAYQAFSGYPAPSSWHASPLRDIEEIKKNLSSARLHQLSPDAVGLYAGSAMTTVGDVDDYKHFLPRILHLACMPGHSQPGLDPEIIACKLDYGDWRGRPAEEKAAVTQFYDRAWALARLLHPDKKEAEGWLCGNAMIGNPLENGLRVWITEPTTDSMVQLAYFLMGADSVAKAVAFWEEVLPETRHQIVDWLLSDVVEAALVEAVSDVAENDLWRFDSIDSSISLLKQARWRE